MADLVSTIEQVVDNIETLFRYGESNNQDERKFHDTRIKNGKLFAAVQVRRSFRYAPSKFAGYVNNDISHGDNLSDRDGRKTNVALSSLIGDALEAGDQGYDAVDRGFLNYCNRKGIRPSQHHRQRRYWVLRPVLPEKPTADPKELSDRVQRALQRIRTKKSTPPKGQGRVSKISTSSERYVRDPEVIAWVLAEAAGVCENCGNPAPFKRPNGEPFLEVHHLRPLGEGGRDTTENAAACCPNCHRRLHYDEVKDGLRLALIASVKRLKDFPTDG
ncbi:HNH endonuclease [Litoreibacter janthinus]|uniref:HNH endonuclease n=1 Tax=Litoreibacter janthinus TaxID=670154 RepID=UPI000B7E280F|nr:HNH endonuclease [Litoreibacter janthinus]